MVRFGNVQIPIPITEGPIYKDAYHGTSRDYASMIEKGGFEASTESIYGPGVYFWLHNIRPAIYWAKIKKGFGSEYAVLECVVRSGQTLHAEQLWEDNQIRKAARAIPSWEPSSHGYKDPDWRTDLVGLVVMVCDEKEIRVDSIQFSQKPKVFRYLIQVLCVRRVENIVKVRRLEPDEVPHTFDEFE